jgi:hypothetical protein
MGVASEVSLLLGRGAGEARDRAGTIE